MRTLKLIAYALATMAISLSCGKQPEPEPTPTPTPKPEEPDTPAVVTPAEPVKVQLIQGNIHQMTYSAEYVSRFATPRCLMQSTFQLKTCNYI